ncbi:MAG: PhoH family protein, partial [Deltaproteobacteria bacterium]|nr:PhoH family protein [Deltaproteobacteria bacterium]
LYDMLDPAQVQRMIENDEIEIAPLAFMRGRTLHHSFVILDEAQNCTPMQMKMCLTRLGVDSKMVVTGDVTQIDLPEGQVSGLLEAMRILDGIEGIVMHAFSEADVVRHPLVRRLVKAYEKTNGD